MKVNTKDRSALKGYFVKNAVPTEGNFATLIDGMLNQADDGIVKPAGNPLCIEASGDDASFKKVINFYDKLSDQNPAWALSLNPRETPSDAASNSPGFSVDDAAGRSRLFIGRSTGNVGIGTCKPTAKLDVRGAVTVNGNLEVTGNVGIGLENPAHRLHVGGGGQIGLEASVVTDSKAGLYWHGATTAYAMFRTPGAWTAPNYQQLTLQFHTGIILRPGTGNNKGYGKSYVDIRGGKGLRVSEGTLGVTGGTGGGYTFGRSNRGMEGGNESGNLHIDGTNNLYLNHYTKKPIYLGSSDIYFNNTAHNHTGLGNQPGYAAIENSKNYNALMILGRNVGSRQSVDRRVAVWDRLSVHGKLFVHSVANNAWAKTQLASAPNNTVILAGTWESHMYFYFKDNKGRILRHMLKGSTF